MVQNQGFSKVKRKSLFGPKPGLNGLMRSPRAVCRAGLERFKVPKGLDFVENPPGTLSLLSFVALLEGNEAVFQLDFGASLGSYVARPQWSNGPLKPAPISSDPEFSDHSPSVSASAPPSAATVAWTDASMLKCAITSCWILAGSIFSGFFGW